MKRTMKGFSVKGFSGAGLCATCALAVLIAVVLAAASCTSEKSRPPEESAKTNAGGQTQDPMIPVDEMPKPLTSAPPAYPEEARAKGVEGTVYVRALVAKDGTVSNAAADPEHPASPLLEKAAIDAVRGWTFSPAKYKGEAVETWIIVPVKFLLH